MLKNYKFLLAVLGILVCSFQIVAQSETEYKDVLLDGKPAKLNIATGEITLVDSNSKQSTTDANKNQNVAKIADSTSSDFHIVKEGESLFDISKQYKVSMTQLKYANNLETTLINEGQRLQVKNFKTLLQSDTEIVKKSPDEIEAKENLPSFHTVKANETLFSLAKRYQLSVEDLKRLNNLNSNLINVGQKLRVSTTEIPNQQTETSIWVVSAGDTLFSIAKKTGTSVETLKTLNGLSSNLLKIGQKLRLK